MAYKKSSETGMFDQFNKYLDSLGLIVNEDEEDSVNLR